MDRRWILVGVVALLPMAAAPLLGRSVSEEAAQRLARLAGTVASILSVAPAEASEPSPGLPPSSPSDEIPPDAIESDPGHPASPTRGSTQSDRGSRAPRKGILVRREVVRAAAKAGLRPSGAPVGPNDDHPAGLQVYGVGGTGALRDGDVITKVGGIAPRSTEDVIAVVAGAYRNKVYVISGEFWRKGEAWNAVVELPEPKAQDQPLQTRALRKATRASTLEETRP